MFSGVIFDLDGVITDTAELHYLAWKSLADEQNLYFDREINEQLKGVSRRASLEIILDGRDYSEQQISELMQVKNQYYVESLESLTEKDILPGVQSLLIELAANRKRIGLASASKNAHAILAKLGLLTFFDGISDGYSVKNSKPSSDVFLHSAGLLNLNYCDCIVIEDAQAGIDAAKSAGMKVVGINHNKALMNVDMQFASTSEMTLMALIQGFGSINRNMTWPD